MKENSNSNKRGFWKSNWHWMLFILFWLLVFPYILNKLILIDRYWNIVGGPKEWLAFWPSYLSALASAVMIAYTAMTLKNNKEQLDELKRQWDEDHTPSVSVSFNFIPPFAYLRFENTSVVEVEDLSMKIELYKGDTIVEGFIPEDRQKVIDNLKINIEPKGIRNLVIRNDLGGLYNDESILLYLKYNGKEKKPIRILCNDMFTIGDNSMWFIMQKR